MTKSELKNVIFAIDYTLFHQCRIKDHEDKATLTKIEINELQNARSKLVEQYGEHISLSPPY